MEEDRQALAELWYRKFDRMLLASTYQKMLMNTSFTSLPSSGVNWIRIKASCISYLLRSLIPIQFKLDANRILHQTNRHPALRCGIYPKYIFDGSLIDAAAECGMTYRLEDKNKLRPFQFELV